MKLFKRFIKIIKNCAFVLGTIFVGTYIFQSLSLSNEARHQIVYASNFDNSSKTVSLPTIKDVKVLVDKQLENNEEAQARYLNNRTQLVQHKANQIALKKEELDRMAAQGYALTGDPAIDAVTVARYRLRKECLKYDLDMTKFASEDDIMKMADIYAKKAEGEKLTDDEIEFYALMKGKTKKLNKIIEKQNLKDLTEQIAENKRQEVQQDRSNGLKHLIRGYEAQTLAQQEQVLPDNTVRSVRGNKIIYTFESQEAFLESGGSYLSLITSNPYGYVVSIQNQRVNSSNSSNSIENQARYFYKRIDPKLIEKINDYGLYIEDTVTNQDKIEIYFSDEITRNKITKSLLPMDENGNIDYTHEADYTFKASTKRSDKMAEEGGLVRKIFNHLTKSKEQKEYEERYKVIK